MMNKNFQKAWLFVALTYFLSALLIIFYLALGGKWIPPASSIVSLVYMFIPMVAAIAVQKFIYKEPLAKPLGISFKLNWWFLVAWLLPVAIAFVTLGISLLFPNVEYSPEMAGLFERLKDVLTAEQLEQLRSQIRDFPIPPVWIALLQILLAGLTVNAVAGFGEELGWRGLLQKEFSFLGFWKSSASIGVIWGIWHAPIILQGHNYPQHPVAGVLMMIIFTLLLSPILSYIRLKAKSVIAAAILHGTLNASSGLPILVIKGGNDLTVGITGLAGFIALGIAILALFLYDRFLAKEPLLLHKGAVKTSS